VSLIYLPNPKKEATYFCNRFHLQVWSFSQHKQPQFC